MKESVDKAVIRVEGFSVHSFGADEDALNGAAYDIASEIGSTLASLGQSCTHGRVAIEIDGMEGES